MGDVGLATVVLGAVAGIYMNAATWCGGGSSIHMDCLVVTAHLWFSTFSEHFAVGYSRDTGERGVHARRGPTDRTTLPVDSTLP